MCLNHFPCVAEDLGILRAFEGKLTGFNFSHVALCCFHGKLAIDSRQ